MSNVDWTTAPKDAEFYSKDCFRKVSERGSVMCWFDESKSWSLSAFKKQELMLADDYEARPDHLIKICMVSSPAINPENIMEEETLEQAISNITSTMLLDEVKSIQQQRAAEYEQGEGERSFQKIATVFNTYTGKDLLPSDIALIFEILKNVRFYAQNGLHRDSVIDKISYASLWGELVIGERG